MPVNQQHDRGHHRGIGSITKCSAAVEGWGAARSLAKALTDAALDRMGPCDLKLFPIVFSKPLIPFSIEEETENRIRNKK